MEKKTNGLEMWLGALSTPCHRLGSSPPREEKPERVETTEALFVWLAPSPVAADAEKKQPASEKLEGGEFSSPQTLGRRSLEWVGLLMGQDGWIASPNRRKQRPTRIRLEEEKKFVVHASSQIDLQGRFVMGQSDRQDSPRLGQTLAKQEKNPRQDKKEISWTHGVIGPLFQVELGPLVGSIVGSILQEHNLKAEGSGPQLGCWIKSLLYGVGPMQKRGLKPNVGSDFKEIGLEEKNEGVMRLASGLVSPNEIKKKKSASLLQAIVGQIQDVGNESLLKLGVISTTKSMETIMEDKEEQFSHSYFVDLEREEEELFSYGEHARVTWFEKSRWN
ncbi:unnamed protein product [Linum trigynum]|uniref:Uncharacterized protein n=1 Tax=Linum trigynum TaxID=586398 RepID=A0AAV2FCG2_9ROSI